MPDWVARVRDNFHGPFRFKPAEMAVCRKVPSFASSRTLVRQRPTVSRSTCGPYAPLLLFVPGVRVQVKVILAAALAGLFLFKPEQSTCRESIALPLSQCAGLFWLGLFWGGLIILPLVTRLFASESLALVDAFYRAGSLVFGGGHVVLPILQAEVVLPAG